MRIRRTGDLSNSSHEVLQGLWLTGCMGLVGFRAFRAYALGLR